MLNEFKNLHIIPLENVQKAQVDLQVTGQIALQNKEALKDYIILHINHVLQDVYALNEILLNMGAEIVYIGVPYSNRLHITDKYHTLHSIRKDIFYLVLEDYIFNEELSGERDLMTSLEKQIRFAIDKYIKPRLGTKKLMILQDGGYTTLLGGYISGEDPIGELNNLVGIVEQTNSGTKLFELKSKAIDLSYPVLTISHSNIKTNYESYFIAQRIFEETNKLFYKIGEFLNFKTIVVGGYGTIGRQLAILLRNIGADVIIYDRDESILRLARREGFWIEDRIFENSIDRSFCYIGCTGTSSFGISEFLEYAKSTRDTYYLISGSSKRTEFLPIIFIFERDIDDIERAKLFEQYSELKKLENLKVVKTEIGFEYQFLFNGHKKKLILMAEGFPINFYDENSESVPEKAIDPIQALLLECMLFLQQESSNIKPGIKYIGANYSDNENFPMNETKIMKKWTEMNQIDIPHSNPLSFFDQHPLKDLLLKKRRTNVK